MTEGAGLLKRGENGKGLASRWYPETLSDRIQALREIRHRVAFEQSDALEVIIRCNSQAVGYGIKASPTWVGVAAKVWRMLRVCFLAVETTDLSWAKI